MGLVFLSLSYFMWALEHRIIVFYTATLRDNANENTEAMLHRVVKTHYLLYAHGELSPAEAEDLPISARVHFRKTSRLHWNVLSFHFLSAMLEYPN